MRTAHSRGRCHGDLLSHLRGKGRGIPCCSRFSGRKPECGQERGVSPDRTSASESWRENRDGCGKGTQPPRMSPPPGRYTPASQQRRNQETSDWQERPAHSQAKRCEQINSLANISFWVYIFWWWWWWVLLGLFCFFNSNHVFKCQVSNFF